MAFYFYNSMIKKAIDLDQHVAFLYRSHVETVFPKITSFLYRVLDTLHPNMEDCLYDF